MQSKKIWRKFTCVTIKTIYAATSYSRPADGAYNSLADAVLAFVRRHGSDALYSLRYGHLQKQHLVTWPGHDPFWTTDIKGDLAVFRDESGLIIPPWRVLEAYQHLPNNQKHGYYRWRSRHGRFKFRDGPVEGIGGGGRYSNYLRYPHTTQEIRENDFINHWDEEAREYNIKASRRRGRFNIPTAWDDQRRTIIKNWKKYRKHQWKD